MGAPDPGYGTLINKLANPPNPLLTLGEDANALMAARQFQADQAGAEAMRAATDPVTGQVNMGRYNALMSQGPGAFHMPQAMQQIGTGVGNEAQATTADVNSKLAQLGAIGNLMEPLYKDAIGKNYVNPADAQAALDQAYQMKLVTPQQYQAYSATLKSSQNAASFVIGANTGNEAARTLVLGRPGMADVGGTVQPYQPVPGALPSAAPPMTKTPTPGEQIQQQQWLAQPFGQNGTYYDPNGQAKAGSVSQWMHDYNVPYDAVHFGPNGTATAPGAPTFQLSPQAAPAAPGPAPAPAPAPQGGPGGGRTTAPAAAPVPAPSAAPSPSPAPAPAPQPQRGGTNVMPATQIQAGESAYNAAAAEQPNHQARITTANLALQSLADATIGGKGTEALQALNNALGTWSPDFIRKIIPDYDPAKAASDYQTAAKYMQQITNASIPGGQGTNEKLAAAATATPNVHMQDMAARQVLQTMISGEQMQQYVFAQFQKTGLPPAQYAKWSANWAQTHDPRAFMLGHMTPDQITYLQKSIKPGSPEEKTFDDTARELMKNGVISDPTKSPVVAPSAE